MISPHTVLDRIGDAARDAQTRIETTRTRVRTRMQDAIRENLTIQQSRVLAVLIMGVSTLSVPAAAQSVEELGTAMCGTGVGQIVGFVFIGLSLFYLLKAVRKTMDALDKMNSTSQSTSREGQDQLSDAGTSAAAAFVPALAAGVFEVLGVNTVSCLAPDSWSIIGAIVLVPF